MFEYRVDFNRDRLDEPAEEFFSDFVKRSSGDDFAENFQAGLAYRDKNVGDVVVKGAYVFTDSTDFDNDLISVDGICLFMITAGDFERFKTYTTLDSYFNDIWGTAYLQGGISLMNRDILAKYKEDFSPEILKPTLSQPFSPGSSNMDMDYNQFIYEMVQGKNIGIELLESGMMTPLKSASGLYFITEGLADELDKNQTDKDESGGCCGNISGCENSISDINGCEDCIGNTNGCGGCIKGENKL